MIYPLNIIFCQIIFNIRRSAFNLVAQVVLLTIKEYLRVGQQGILENDNFQHTPLSTHTLDVTVGGGLNQDLQNYKWNPLWLYMRLWDVKRFFEIFSVLTLHRPPQISEKWGKMAHFGRFPTFSYWLVWSLNY